MKKVFILNGLDCANCAMKLEEAINKIDDVTNASVNFFTSKLTLDSDNMDNAILKVKEVVKKIEPDVSVE